MLGHALKRLSHPGRAGEHRSRIQRRSRAGNTSCALENTDPHPGDHRVRNLVYLCGDKTDRLLLRVLRIHLRIVGTCGESLDKRLSDNLLC